jgi:hypothetical protein
MPIKVRVSKKSHASFEIKKGVSARTGKPYAMPQQTVSIYHPDDEDEDAEKFVISVPDDMPKGYVPGWYSWDIERALTRSAFDAPALDMPTLVYLAPLESPPVNDLSSIDNISTDNQLNKPKAPLFQKPAVTS